MSADDNAGSDDEFVTVADTVATEAEALADRLTGFTGLNAPEIRACSLAEQYLREAAHMLAEVAEVDYWSPGE